MLVFVALWFTLANCITYLTFHPLHVFSTLLLQLICGVWVFPVKAVSFVTLATLKGAPVLSVANGMWVLPIPKDEPGPPWYSSISNGLVDILF